MTMKNRQKHSGVILAVETAMLNATGYFLIFSNKAQEAQTLC